MVWALSSRKAETNQRIMACLGVEVKTAKAIQRRMYKNLGYTVAEFFRIPHMSEREVKNQITPLHPERLPASGKYIALVTHTGNWELIAACTSLFGFGNTHVLVKSLKPARFNEWILKVRTHWGTHIHDRRGATRELLRILKTEEPLAFILDQNTKHNWGVYVDFFGKPACTSDGLAQLAAISGYEIHPVFCRRDMKTRKLIVEIGEQIPGPIDRSPEQIQQVTALCTKKIEDFIRQYPDQWIWMHRRWRTQPPA